MILGIGMKASATGTKREKNSIRIQDFDPENDAKPLNFLSRRVCGKIRIFPDPFGYLAENGLEEDKTRSGSCQEAIAVVSIRDHGSTGYGRLSETDRNGWILEVFFRR